MHRNSWCLTCPFSSDNEQERWRKSWRNPNNLTRLKYQHMRRRPTTIGLVKHLLNPVWKLLKILRLFIFQLSNTCDVMVWSPWRWLYLYEHIMSCYWALLNFSSWQPEQQTESCQTSGERTPSSDRSKHTVTQKYTVVWIQQKCMKYSHLFYFTCCIFIHSIHYIARSTKCLSYIDFRCICLQADRHTV